MLAAERQQAWVRESSPLKNGRSSEGASRSEGTYFAGVFCVLLVIIGTSFFVLTKVQGNTGAWFFGGIVGGSKTAPYSEEIGAFSPDGTMTPISTTEAARAAKHNLTSIECPLNLCPGKCNENGLCLRNLDNIDCACTCHTDYGGDDCSLLTDQAAKAEAERVAHDMSADRAGGLGRVIGAAVHPLGGTYIFNDPEPNIPRHIVGISPGDEGYDLKSDTKTDYVPDEPYDDPDAKGYHITVGVGFAVLCFVFICFGCCFVFIPKFSDDPIRIPTRGVFVG